MSFEEGISNISIEIRVPQQSRDQRCWILQRENCSKVLAENDLSLCKFCFLNSTVLFVRLLKSRYSENSEPVEVLGITCPVGCEGSSCFTKWPPHGGGERVVRDWWRIHMKIYSQLRVKEKTQQTCIWILGMCFSSVQWESKYQLSLYIDIATPSQCCQPVGQGHHTWK